MKNESQILNAIANACKDEKLHFQVIIQDSSLHVYINRPAEASLNYHSLKDLIYTTIINLPSANFRQIWLNSRVLGQIEPDWQAVLELENSTIALEEVTSMVAAITTAVDTTSSIVSKIEQELEVAESFSEDPQIEFEDLPTTASDEPFDLSEAELSELIEDSIKELDLSQYCFIKNRHLLYAVLNLPWFEIAHLIDTFDRFKTSIKRSQLPVLEAYLLGFIAPNLNNIEPEVVEWWSKIEQLDPDNRHKFALWLSRYCLDTPKTMATIQTVLDANAIAKEGADFSSLPQAIPESKQHSPTSLSWIDSLKISIGNFLKIFKTK